MNNNATQNGSNPNPNQNQTDLPLSAFRYGMAQAQAGRVQGQIQTQAQEQNNEGHRLMTHDERVAEADRMAAEQARELQQQFDVINAYRMGLQA